MSNIQEPNWHHIRNLPMIANMIDGQFTETKNQLRNLLQARENPYILDDTTIDRLIKVFTEQQEYIPIFDGQLSKWQLEEKLSIVPKKAPNLKKSGLQHQSQMQYM